MAQDMKFENADSFEFRSDAFEPTTVSSVAGPGDSADETRASDAWPAKWSGPQEDDEPATTGHGNLTLKRGTFEAGIEPESSAGTPGGAGSLMDEVPEEEEPLQARPADLNIDLEGHGLPGGIGTLTEPEEEEIQTRPASMDYTMVNPDGVPIGPDPAPETETFDSFAFA